ncbi:MAG: cell division protein FtsA [Elusimicrobiota bacterium]
MSREKIVAGLDVGSSKVACVIAKKNESDLPEIIGIGVAPCKGLKNGSVVSIRETVKAIDLAVDAAEELADERVDELIVGIKGQHIESINHTTAINVVRTDKEIIHDDIVQIMSSAKAIRLPADREIIHTIPQEFSIDGQSGIEDPVGLEGCHLSVNVHIITGISSYLNNLQKSINNAGFVCKEFISSILAAGEVTVSPEEKKIGCVLIDMGAQTTDIAIYCDKSIRYIKEIPLGGDDITSDITHGLRTSFAIARELKEKYGSTISALIDPKEEITHLTIEGRSQKIITRQQLCNIIKSRVEDILTILNDEITKTQYKDMISAGAIITGGGSQLLGMKEACEEILQLPTVVATPQYVRSSVEGKGGVSISDPSLSCAIGLVKANFSELERSSRYPLKKPGLLTKFKRLLENVI